MTRNNNTSYFSNFLHWYVCCGCNKNSGHSLWNFKIESSHLDLRHVMLNHKPIFWLLSKNYAQNSIPKFFWQSLCLWTMSLNWIFGNECGKQCIHAWNIFVDDFNDDWMNLVYKCRATYNWWHCQIYLFSPFSRWLDYSNMNKPVQGLPIIAFKTPLCQVFLAFLSLSYVCIQYVCFLCIW